MGSSHYSLAQWNGPDTGHIRVALGSRQGPGGTCYRLSCTYLRGAPSSPLLTPAPTPFPETPPPLLTPGSLPAPSGPSPRS